MGSCSEVLLMLLHIAQYVNVPKSLFASFAVFLSATSQFLTKIAGHFFLPYQVEMKIEEKYQRTIRFFAFYQEKWNKSQTTISLFAFLRDNLPGCLKTQQRMVVFVLIRALQNFSEAITLRF